MKPITKESQVVGWWSGGVTSAVACKVVIDVYGASQCRIIFIDTGNEDEDTYRFMKDCHQWYGVEIETITGLGGECNSIQDVWYKYNSLNVAHGAICSSTLKRDVRLKWEKENDYEAQAFGFDLSEPNRVVSMAKNYPKARPIFPLWFFGYSKKDCLSILKSEGIEPPIVYSYGFNNNNCFKTGCIQGGIGYWQKMKREWPDKFEAMAKVEHELTDRIGEPVTMLKDQSKEAKAKLVKDRLVFLLPHPDYPHLKDLSQMKGREPRPIMDCNGFCGLEGFQDNSIDELNLQPDPEHQYQIDLFESLFRKIT